jgi:hypothetical protein
MAVDKAGRHVRLVGVRYINPHDRVMAEMLTGWRNQQLSRNLAFTTIDQREAVVRRFQRFTNEYPSTWSPAHAEEFFGICVPNATQSSRRFAVISRVCAHSVDMSLIRIMAGMFCANSCSERTRRRSVSTGTARCTSRTPRPDQTGERSPDESSRTSSTTPMMRSFASLARTERDG